MRTATRCSWYSESKIPLLLTTSPLTLTLFISFYLCLSIFLICPPFSFIFLQHPASSSMSHCSILFSASILLSQLNTLIFSYTLYLPSYIKSQVTFFFLLGYWPPREKRASRIRMMYRRLYVGYSFRQLLSAYFLLERLSRHYGTERALPVSQSDLMLELECQQRKVCQFQLILVGDGGHRLIFKGVAKRGPLDRRIPGEFAGMRVQEVHLDVNVDDARRRRRQREHVRRHSESKCIDLCAPATYLNANCIPVV